MKEEARIESECVAYAHRLGWMSRKLDAGPGGKGWIDQIFLGPRGEWFLAEFKVAGETPKGKQKKTIERLAEIEHNVIIFTDVESFKMCIKAHTKQ